MPHDQALTYLRSLTDDQAQLEELLASVVTPNARKVFVLEGQYCGKTTFISLLCDILRDVDFWYFFPGVKPLCERWDASSVVETSDVSIASLPETPFAVFIIDAHRPYEGPLHPTTTITFHPLEVDIDDMRDQLWLMKYELLDIINKARDNHPRLMPFSQHGCIC